MTGTCPSHTQGDVQGPGQSPRVLVPLLTTAHPRDPTPEAATTSAGCTTPLAVPFSSPALFIPSLPYDLRCQCSSLPGSWQTESLWSPGPVPCAAAYQGPEG